LLQQLLVPLSFVEVVLGVRGQDAVFVFFFLVVGLFFLVLFFGGGYFFLFVGSAHVRYYNSKANLPGAFEWVLITSSIFVFLWCYLGVMRQLVRR
jgi:hypothetical protein